MKIEKAQLEDLISPEWNPRQITNKEMDKLKKSIQEFGYVDPIIVNRHNNHIVGGNQRAFAMSELGYTEVEVIYIDEPNLDKEKALNIALNKISGDWDTLKLEDILKELNFSELSLTGFDDYELELFRNDELDLSDLLNYETEEEELPSDFMDVTGHDANKNYVISIAFPSKEDANRFVEYFGCEKTMKRDTLQLHIDELGINYYT